MTGTWAIVGEPISVSGISYRPPFLTVDATLNASGVWLEPWRVGANPPTGSAVWTTDDIVPPPIGTTELTALVARGGATQIG
jgi:hypothetical protein